MGIDFDGPLSSVDINVDKTRQRVVLVVRTTEDQAISLDITKGSAEGLIRALQAAVNRLHN